MPLPTAALHAYCITIFETGSRTLSQFQPAWQEELKVHAVKVENYPVEVYDKTLLAERITQVQYDQLVAMMPPPTPAPIDEVKNDADSGEGGDSLNNNENSTP
ncbi:hypothetical protein [Paenibacillus shenyangensis]|uniref:hypothetical protein n=1 Tax=Paenibacillus sp. A9 TaxID=1284352 RepID=UPI000369EF33|nr:hypothetical protein [Paenibacillus sp. A9]